MCQCGSTDSECGCESLLLPVIKGENGASSYELWLSLGNTGTLQDFLDSQVGAPGAEGQSAYDVAVANGYTGSEAQWLLTLNGDDGDPGINGVDGRSPIYTLAQDFVMPAFDSVATAVLTEPPALFLIGQPVYLAGAGTLRVTGFPSAYSVELQNPNVNWDLSVAGHPELSGVPGNTAAGNVIPAGNKVVPGGRPGKTVVGPPGTSIPGDTGADGADGLAGATILFLNADPNTQPSSYGAEDDIVYDDSVLGQWRIWQKTAPTTWTLRGTITGAGAPAVNAQVFRAGKSANQPIPVGSGANTVMQFELSSGAGFYNGGWWNGSSYNAQSGITTPMTFIAENIRIFRTAGSGETITFEIDITIDGVVVEAQNMVITSPATEVILPVITTGPQAVTSSSVVKIVIKPSGSPTEQWYVDATNIVFYNQV